MTSNATFSLCEPRLPCLCNAVINLDNRQKMASGCAFSTLGQRVTTQSVTLQLSLSLSGAETTDVQRCTFQHKAVADVTFMSTRPDATSAEGQTGTWSIQTECEPVPQTVHTSSTLTEHTWCLLQFWWLNYALCVCLFSFCDYGGRIPLPTILTCMRK